MKGVGRLYQQRLKDTYTQLVCPKRYDRKTPIMATELLNDRVVALFDDHEIALLRALTDCATEYCGNLKRHA